jgi:acyl carrier protein
MENTENIMRIIRENTDYQGEIFPSDHLKNDLHLDSLDINMIINAVEDRYSIIVDGEDLNCLKTVSDIAIKLTELRRA